MSAMTTVSVSVMARGGTTRADDPGGGEQGGGLGSYGGACEERGHAARR